MKFLAKLVLKIHLLIFGRINKFIISFFGEIFFGGLHPKNIFNYRNEFFLEHAGKEDCVVDIACGTGLILSKISGDIKKGYGIDYDKKNVKIANEKFSQSNLKFIEGDIYNFDYSVFQRNNNISIAILSHILEHIEDVPTFLKKVNIKTLLICVPSQENWATQLLIHLGLPYMKDISHFREYTREMLELELKQSGYKVESMGFNPEGEIICKAVRS